MAMVYQSPSYHHLFLSSVLILSLMQNNTNSPLWRVVYAPSTTQLAYTTPPYNTQYQRIKMHTIAAVKNNLILSILKVLSFKSFGDRIL